MNTCRLLGLNLKELRKICEEESKLPYSETHFKSYSQCLIASLEHLDTIHSHKDNFKDFINIFSRGVATITLEEIRKYNLLEILFRECFIMVEKIPFSSGDSHQEELASILKFLVNKIPKSEFKEFIVKYKLVFENSQNSQIRQMYIRSKYET